MDYIEFVVFLVTGDLLCIALQNSSNLDKNIANLIINNTQELFLDLFYRQFGIWAKSNLIVDQWTYVIRRISKI